MTLLVGGERYEGHGLGVRRDTVLVNFLLHISSMGTLLVDHHGLLLLLLSFIFLDLFLVHHRRAPLLRGIQPRDIFRRERFGMGAICATGPSALRITRDCGYVPVIPGGSSSSTVVLPQVVGGGGMPLFALAARLARSFVGRALAPRAAATRPGVPYIGSSQGGCSSSSGGGSSAPSIAGGASFVLIVILLLRLCLLPRCRAIASG
mmetsp:Transcript_16513/g.29873  ORF Transcript_16513/g.29873 Transcript_16513/m.29873 type:complete len:206 (+) Transcript_16513:363-980(+)